MKKSLSLLLAIALVFSMFSSLALAADGLTVEQKYEALKAEGIFSGMGDGSAGLDQKMTRAQFARIAGLLAGLDVDATPSTKTFSDVADNHWAIEEIEAAAAAGLVEGMGDGTFNPSGNVTIQQLAVVAAKILKLDPVEDAEVEGAAAWAAPYIQALLDAGVDFPTNYTEDALRADLVSVSYEVAQRTGVVTPAQVSVVSAKQANAKDIEVTLNKAVDTEKAKLEVKRGSATLASTTKWAEDKKSAIVTLDATIQNDTYTVVLSGVDNIGTASAEFVGEQERITSIEILTASDVLPMADNVKVEFAAINQFGKQSSLTASNFSISTGGVGTFVPVSDEQAFRLNLKDQAKDTIVPVTIIHNTSSISANKVFKVGEPPIVSKVEIGDIIYADNKTRVETNDNFGLQFTAYDQYGIPVNIDLDTATGFTGGMDYGLDSPRGVTVVSNDPSVVDIDATPFADLDGDGQLDLALVAKTPAYTSDDKNVTVTIYAHGSNQSASKVITVVQPKQPATVEFGSTNLQLAEGDSDKYLPIILRDKEGNELSVDDIVAAEQNGKLTIYVTNGNVILGADPAGTNNNGSTQVIQRNGDNRGKIRIDNVSGKGSGQVVVMITGTNPVQQAAWSFNIADARVPTSIKVTEAPAPKMIHADGADVTENKFKLQVYDQYGEKVESDVTNYEVRFELKAIGTGTVATDIVTLDGITADNATGYGIGSYASDDELKLISSTSRTGTVEVIARLYDTSKTPDLEVAKATTRTQVITGTESGLNLTYTVEIDGAKDNTLYALYKGKVTVGSAVYGESEDGRDSVTALSGLKQAKGIKVSAKDGSGNNVALPNNRIINSSIVVANTGVAQADTGAGKLVGWDAGTTEVTVAFKTPTGHVTETQTITVKKDALTVDSISGDKGSNSVNVNTLIGGVDVWHDKLFNEVKVVDQYGTEYKDAEINQYNFRVAYYVRDIEYSGDDAVADTITISGNTLTYVNNGDRNITKFTLDAVAPNGKKASVTVQVFGH